MKRNKCFWIFSFLIWMAASVMPVFADSAASKILEEIAIQNNGRMKPFQTFARETALQVTGKSSWENLDATELVWNWMANPEKWNQQPMIPVSFRPLRKEFPNMLVQNRLSPELILGHRPFLDQVEISFEKQRRKENLSSIEKERLSLYNKAAAFREIGMGAQPGWLPDPENTAAGWMSLQVLASAEGMQKITKHYSPEKMEGFRKTLSSLIQIVASPSGFAASDAEKSAREFSSALDALRESAGIHLDQKMIHYELLYHRAHFFQKAWMLYLAGLFIFLLSMKIKNPALHWGGIAFVAAGFLFHTYGFYLRCVIAGRPPVSNMYESIVWVSWAAVLFSVPIFWAYRNGTIPAAASAVAAFALMIADSFPVFLDPHVSPLVPVLRSNLWLTVHVLTITMSYGAFLLAWGLGHVVIVSYALRPQAKDQNLELVQFLYRALQIGVILLAAGTVLGGVWANYSWGRFWGWDPKETWALIALLGYLAVLHGRYTGWLDAFGLAAASAVAFALVIMAWYGVNFVLAAGLHSYGFGGGGAPYVLSVVLADLALIGAFSLVYQQKQKTLARRS